MMKVGRTRKAEKITMGSAGKGSALLIVLGIVSFLVVSALGFSIFMRTSRLPSSYLRRNITARHLVRAALAKAIGELEGDFNMNLSWGPKRFYGIYDDPFPGILSGADSTERQSDNSNNGDFWLGRVFMPFGAVESAEDTVSTLTLEGLAYLPPAIIDDVRRLSRYTRTANWRTFSYGEGAGGPSGEKLHNKRQQLMFAEIPFGVAGSQFDDANKKLEGEAAFSDSTSTLLDCVLQYKFGNYQKAWKGPAEAMAFNHKNGKHWCAHVVFADCHTEKLRLPESGISTTELTAYLCEGIPVDFNGRGYSKHVDAIE